MDLNTITQVLSPRTRADLTGLGPGDALLAGGTWLFSEPQENLARLVDLRALGWPPVEATDAGLTVAATCTIEQLVAAAEGSPYPAAPLFRQCAQALLASFKIWKAATVGGNLCLGLPAGAVTSLTAALDASLLIWTPDGGERRCAVPDFVTGAGRTSLEPGEVLRSVTFPGAALACRTAFRKIALAPLGRSGSVVAGRATDSGPVVSVTAATERPVLLRGDIQGQLATVDCWFTDPHGPADWRRHVTGLLVAEVLEELA